MLANSLQEIKGRLFHYFFQVYSDMNSFEDEDKKIKIDYEEFYSQSKNWMREISEIANVSDLDRFCEDWGLNDMQNELSFNNLATEYLKPKSE